MQTLIHNATLVLPEHVVENGWLLIDGEHIAGIGGGAYPGKIGGMRVVDAHACFLMPGLIDLHCDGIERFAQPRPNADFDIHLALKEADWRLAGCGVTTEFHAVSLDDGEFGIRSDRFVYELQQALRTKTDLLVRHKLHVRLELSSRKSVGIIARMIEKQEVNLVSIMDHSPGQGQYVTEQSFREYVVRTTNRSYADIDALIAMKRAEAVEIPARIEYVTHLAREAGITIATHDDDTAAKVEQWPELGVSISEFPTTLVAATRAHELGLKVCMGAPNALRGRSSGGNLSAMEAIRSGVADALSSDYYPAAMLGAVFSLASQQILALPQATKLVTLNPAQAIDLGHDFGSLEVNKVADVILVRVSRQGIPIVQRAFVGGEEKVVRVCNDNSM